MSKSPKVMIVGAGLGSLLLALLPEKVGVEYDIYERSASLKPYGAGMSLGANILPVFEQLGIYEDLLKISLPCSQMELYKEDMIPVSKMNLGGENVGYDTQFFSRPDVHSLLLSKLPAERIHCGKKVLSVGQSEHGTMIRCADGTSYEGDILIGADGAYSAARQGLYKRLEKEGKLPKSDSEPMEVGYTCLVGTTLPLDSEKYPIVKDNFSHFAIVVADKGPYSVMQMAEDSLDSNLTLMANITVISVPGNRVCWGVVIQLTPEEQEAAFRNSDWAPKAIKDAIAPFAHHKTPFGGTLEDLVNETPKEHISNAYLEEKILKPETMDASHC
ncbi:hypothetical protein BGX26_012535 [Mortierella sp. AD094]|nr:hypothetical protein BGX26_012535 [Mortierella sp. AD094]